MLNTTNVELPKLGPPACMRDIPQLAIVACTRLGLIPLQKWGLLLRTNSTGGQTDLSGVGVKKWQQKHASTKMVSCANRHASNKRPGVRFSNHAPQNTLRVRVVAVYNNSRKTGVVRQLGSSVPFLDGLCERVVHRGLRGLQARSPVGLAYECSGPQRYALQILVLLLASMYVLKL